jgi:hypothetical protein
MPRLERDQPLLRIDELRQTLEDEILGIEPA